MTALDRRRAAAFLCVAAVLGGGQAVAGNSRDPRFDASAALAVSQAAVGRPLSEYVFTNDLNRKIELADLRGKPLVISLVYTGCGDICPVVSESLADAVDVAGNLFGKDAFNVITVGFDARNDTPQRMRAYARSHGLERPNWQFLSADAGTVDRLASELGFLFYASPRGFDHLSQTTIVDPEGRVYGQIYGASFNPPQLVEPLKDLVFGRDRSSGGWAGLVGQVRLFCTFYDPASGRYRFDYSVFLTTILGGLSLAGVAVVLARAAAAATAGEGGPRPDSSSGGEAARVMRTGLRYGFQWVEGWLDRAFGPRWNPLYALGALGFFYYWVVAVSGIYLFVFFDTGIPEAFDSVEAITYEQWWLGGIMRSLHRYASDAMVLMLGLHVLREFTFDQYRGTRWYSWVTGVPTIWLLLGAGITGYWLVWDRLAQYVAEATTEWLDWLPIFGSPTARNFLAPSYLEDRFFTLMVFIHIALPLVLLFVMWFHINRVSAPKMNAPRGLAIGTFLMLLALSLIKPAESQGIADLAQTPSPIGLDWFYLWVYPLIAAWDAGPVWVLAFAGTLLLMLMPWLPPRREKAIARVSISTTVTAAPAARWIAPTVPSQ